MEIKAKIESLPKVLTSLHEEAKALGLASLAIHQLEIALEEHMVNIIQHGYKNEKNDIEIDFSKVGTQFCITIRDHGPAFNLIEKEVSVDTKASVQDRNLGGLGLLFIKKFTDYLEYRRLGDMNEVKMYKEI